MFGERDGAIVFHLAISPRRAPLDAKRKDGAGEQGPMQSMGIPNRGLRAWSAAQGSRRFAVVVVALAAMGCGETRSGASDAGALASGGLAGASGAGSAFGGGGRSENGGAPNVSKPSETGGSGEHQDAAAQDSGHPNGSRDASLADAGPRDSGRGAAVVLTIGRKPAKIRS